MTVAQCILPRPTYINLHVLMRMLSQVPLNFASISDYTAAFEPLLVEEAREGVRSAFYEGLDQHRSRSFTMTR